MKKKSNKQSSKRRVIETLALPISLAGFLVMCYFWNVTQDDSFITFRYAEHYLQGHGLVWNIGERVEGYTNFLWLILVIFFKTLGISYLASAKALGVMCSVGTITVSHLLIRRYVIPEITALATFSVGALLASNYSFAYWTMSGMETALFTFLIVSALYAYLNKSWLLAPVLTLAILTRPEGALLAGFFVLYALTFERRFPKFELSCVAVAAIPLIPFIAFKLNYFGGILPNPFYAKTQWDINQLKAGLNYLWIFCKQFGMFGILLLVPAFFWRRLSSSVRLIFVFGALYTLYIVVVGGDVLHANRFFVPILPALFIPFVAVILSESKKRIWQIVIITLAVLIQLGIPHKNLRASYTAELALNKQSRFVAEYMLKVDTTDFTVAASTIGQTGFVLMDHDVIDMVGLTDSTIARHPQEPIENLSTTWRERSYNAEYVLKRAPEYFLFGAATKPSSPGEKALFLYDTFLRGYRTIGFYWSEVGSMIGVYKRMVDSLGEIKREYPAEFVNYYHDGLTQLGGGRYDKALYYLDSARQYGPEDPYLELMYHAANCLAKLNMHEQAFNVIEQIVAVDSNVFSAHQARYLSLYRYPEMVDQALESREQIMRLAPWEIPRLDSLAGYTPEK